MAAVIDKDKSSAKLAEALEADMLVILTAVDRVCIHYNTPQQEELSSLTVQEAEKYIAEGQFAPGSMLPKVESCLQFVKGKGIDYFFGTGKRSIGRGNRHHYYPVNH